MAARSGAVGRCLHCGKTVWRSYRRAARTARRLPIKGSVYWHPQGGGFCITSLEPGDYDRRQAEALDAPTPPSVMIEGEQ